MGIVLSEKTRVVVQGITGKEGRFWTEFMLMAGTNIVAGVTPGRGGQEAWGIPVYNSIRAAMKKHEIDTSAVFAPPAFAKDAVFEALDAGLKTVVLLADGLPVHHALAIRALASQVGAMVIGPNTPGIITIGQAMLGFIPFWLERVYQPGRVGFMSRSGSLTNEIASHIVKNGHGLTSFVGVGGDLAPCTRFVEVIKLFAQDPQTESVVIVGEIGGTMEEEVAAYIKESEFAKPVVAYIAGRTAPSDKRMGHAGAIILGEKGTVANKERAFLEAGVTVATTPSEVGSLVKRILGC